MASDLKKYGAAILCGGQSRRMGCDKSIALVNPQGSPLLAAQARELATRFGEVALVTNDLAKLARIPELSAFKQLPDLHPGAGPAGAIHTALRAMDGQALFIMACDMPIIAWPLIQNLAALMESRGAAISVPRRNETPEPLYGFYSPLAEPFFRHGLAQNFRKVQLFYDEVKTCYLDVDEDAGSKIFTNLNTPSDILRHQGIALDPRMLSHPIHS